MKRSPLSRRTPLKKMSAKRRKALASRRLVREQVFQRDGHTCQAVELVPNLPCTPWLTFHHLQKASALGGYTEGNGLTLCSAHNEWVEDNPKKARAAGLVVRWWDAA